MGLTVAEAFMLIAFVILLLLLFWRHQVHDEVERASKLSRDEWEMLERGAKLVLPQRLEELREMAALVNDPLRRTLAESLVSLEPEAVSKLIRLAKDPNTFSSDLVQLPMEQFEELKKQTERAAQFSSQEWNLIEQGAQLVSEEHLAELQDRAQLLEDPEQRTLAETAATLEPDELRKLTDLARTPELMAVAAELSAGAVPVPQMRLAMLEKHEQWIVENKDEIDQALDFRRAIDPEGEDNNEVLMARIEHLLAKEAAFDGRLAEDAAERRKFIDNLQRELAVDVKKAGGQIDPFGRVIFPQNVVFPAGSETIPPDFMAVLDEICPRWLAELKKSTVRFDIDEIRIEGHSSKEWGSARTLREAWVKNLALSQSRAQSVLKYCLDHVADTPLGVWVRSKMTAVGYSSSRSLVVNGKEDTAASRRVVLGHEFSRERLIADLGKAGQNEGGTGAINRVSGKAQVIHADTIRVEGTAKPIRLDGIMAPQAPCIGLGGRQWDCGQQAIFVLKNHIADRSVICEDLRPGLMRLRGICRVEGEEIELNLWLLETGWASASVRSTKVYLDREAAARRARRGIWSDGVPEPSWNDALAR